MDSRSSFYGDRTETTMGEVHPFENESYEKQPSPGSESLTGHMEFFEPTISHREIVFNKPTETSPSPSDQPLFQDPVKVSSEGPFSETIKKINREIAKRISQEDEKHFIAEHGELVKKKFKSGLSKDEQSQLDFIRWQLDRIDDARQESLSRERGVTQLKILKEKE